MKYLEISHISKTNNLFKKFRELNPLLNIELEAFSCKSNKKEKGMEKHIEKPLRYLLSSLQLCFPDYDFKSGSWSDFTRCSMDDVKTALIYSISTGYKNIDDIKEFVDFLTIILNKSVGLDTASIYSYEGRMGAFEDCTWYFCFLFFSKQRKRVVVLRPFQMKLNDDI